MVRKAAIKKPDPTPKPKPGGITGFFEHVFQTIPSTVETHLKNTFDDLKNHQFTKATGDLLSTAPDAGYHAFVQPVGSAVVHGTEDLLTTAGSGTLSFISSHSIDFFLVVFVLIFALVSGLFTFNKIRSFI